MAALAAGSGSTSDPSAVDPLKEAIMAYTIQIHRGSLDLSTNREERVMRHLQSLERRLGRFPDPVATLRFTDHPARREVEVDLRLELVPKGTHILSHQTAETADHAVRLAVEDVERQLEKQLASMRGEESWGVPSRREPESDRPNPPTATPEPAGQDKAETVWQAHGEGNEGV
jgi:ribosome-associated translation inhibitor RaiA